MDRDVALSIVTSLTAIKDTMETLATNTTPTAPDSRSVTPDPEENQRSAPAEAPEEEPEAPEEEPELITKEKK